MNLEEKYKHDDVDFKTLKSLIQSELEPENIPIILESIMRGLKIYNIPNWRKKQIATDILCELIDNTIENKIIANFCKQIIPQLIDTFVGLAKSKNAFKNAKKFCCK